MVSALDSEFSYSSQKIDMKLNILKIKHCIKIPPTLLRYVY